MEYRPPHVKKKRTKGVKQITSDLSRYDSSATPLVGLLWGGNIWIKDTPTITILTQNGCYGNAVTNRHIAQPDIEKRAIEGTSSGCGQVGVVSSTCIEGNSPPNKKLKKCNDEATDSSSSSLLCHLMLNMATYHSLLPSEGLYLSNMSRMTIQTEEGVALSIEDTRKKMVEWDVQFDVKYLVYKHFRSIGWVPKCGAKFGVDYLLYEPGGPMLYHSSLGVIIVEGSGDISGGSGGISGGSVNISGGSGDISGRSGDISGGSGDISGGSGDISGRSGDISGGSGDISGGSGDISGGSGDISGGSGDISGTSVGNTGSDNIGEEHVTTDVDTKGVHYQTHRESARRLRWQDVLGADRVVGGNKKDLIICNVRTPIDSVGGPIIKSIACKRWLIDKDRLT